MTLPRFPGSVWALQLGYAVNFFGFGMVLPFEIIYLHDIRGFATTTAGHVLSTVMASSAVTSPPAGTLVDRIGGKPMLAAGSVLSAAGCRLGSSADTLRCSGSRARPGSP